MLVNPPDCGIEREDLRGWVEVGIGDGYVVHLGYRTVEIAEISVGYRW